MKKFALPSVKFVKVSTILGEFWNWWKAELSDLIPARLKAELAAPKNTLSVYFGQRGLMFLEPNSANSKRQPLKTSSKKKKALPLRLDYDQINVSLGPDIVFSQTLTLPKVSDRDLRDIIDLKIERLIPLQKSKVKFAYHTKEHGEGKDPRAGLFVVKNRDIDNFFKAMEKIRIRTRAIRFHPEGFSHTRFLNINLPSGLKKKLTMKDSLKRPVLVSLLFWAVIFIGVLGGVLAYEAQLQSKVDTLRSEVSGKIAIIETFETQVAKEEALAKAFSDYRALAILDELARLLPTGAWVEDFSLDNGRIIITGTHKNPSELVEALEASSFFQNVAMPSVSSGAVGQETLKFRISLEFEQQTGGRT